MLGFALTEKLPIWREQLGSRDPVKGLELHQLEQLDIFEAALANWNQEFSDLLNASIESRPFDSDRFDLLSDWLETHLLEFHQLSNAQVYEVELDKLLVCLKQLYEKQLYVTLDRLGAIQKNLTDSPDTMNIEKDLSPVGLAEYDRLKKQLPAATMDAYIRSLAHPLGDLEQSYPSDLAAAPDQSSAPVHPVKRPSGNRIILFILGILLALLLVLVIS